VPILLQNRHTDGAGRPVHFFWSHPLSPAGLCGRPTLDFT